MRPLTGIMMSPCRVCLLNVTLIAVIAVVVQAQTINRGPVWIENLINKLQKEGILENLPTGTELGYLQASDPEGGQITYTTTSNIFSVDRVTGRVALNRMLDAEDPATTQMRVTFIATDPVGNRAEVTYTFLILDVNDQSPVFENLPYSVVVSENAQVGTTIFSGIFVTDADHGNNAVITLLCEVPDGDEEARQACQKFEVSTFQEGQGRYRGIVTLADILNHEAKRNYRLTLAAQDGGNPPLRTTVNVAIDVRDTSDAAPVFLDTLQSIMLHEDTRVGSQVGVIRVRDGDGGVANPIQISIINDPRNIFTLDASVRDGNGYSAVVRTRQAIDARVLGSRYEFSVRATEVPSDGSTGAYSDATLTVTLQDINNYAPTFDKPFYNVSVSESLPRHTSIKALEINVTDADLNQNAEFRLELVGDQHRAFSLSQDRAYGFASVTLIVQQPQYLDYEQEQYRTHRMQVVARETSTVEQRSSTATVQINLFDANDNNPQFVQRQYNFTVREDRESGHRIGQVVAVDGDAGHFGQIRYMITGSGADNKFRIDPSTGELFLQGTLDFEQRSEYLFTVQAIDGGESKRDQTEVRVYVMNSNDLGPVFDVDIYETYVTEGETTMIPQVTVVARDPESRSRVSYRIIHGNTPDSAFFIGQYSGLVEMRRPVQYEETPAQRGFFELTVQASDNENPPQTATIPVKVNIRDVNNNAPRFERGYYYQTIQETDPPATSVVTVRATDQDSGNNADVRYILFSGHKDNFMINYVTGLVEVAPRANLDIDLNGATYTMIVHAVDQGSPPLTGTAQIVVQVTDGNNKPPKFSQDTYLMSVIEDATVGTSVGRVEAVDPDVGARVEYTINSGSFSARDKNGQSVFSTTQWDYRRSFTVDRNSGYIRSDLLFDRDVVAEVTFQVTARDVSVQDQTQIGTATVVVSIQGSGDNQVKFNPPWTPENPFITLSLPEEQPLETEVTTVAATDPFTGRAIQDFREVPGSDPNGYFRVQRTTGKIFLTGRLDYENLPNKRVSFQLEAFTPGPRVRSAMATIIVDVEDINDNSPVFQQNEYSFTFSENTLPPAQVGVVVATDADTGKYGEIYYTLSGLGAELFRIDENGYIYLADGASVNREQRGQYYLLLNAEDNRGGTGIQQKTSISIIFHVLDENDNSPKFLNSEYNLYTLETIRAQTSLGQVQASDPDEGENGRITYKIISGNAELFTIDENSGVIYNLRDLQGFADVRPYQLRVEARDHGMQSRTDFANVRIQVDNLRFILDGRPRFISPERDNLYIPVQEEITVGTNIIQVIAQDDDPGPAGEVVYTFLENDDLPDHKYFSIDPLTGWVTSTLRLDRETKQIYTLILVARDKSSPPKESTRTLFINLTDINDNNPSFKDCKNGAVDGVLSASIKEEEDPPVIITNIYGCDPDGGDNNNMYYFITCGNEPDENSTVPPFAIDRFNGSLISMVKLDRETVDRYRICVKVTNDPNFNATGIDMRPGGPSDDGSILFVDINVSDVDDNPPIWGGGGGGGSGGTGGGGTGGGGGVIGGKGQNTLVAGVDATAPYGSSVARIFVIDRDGEGTSDNTFSLIKSRFHFTNGTIVERPLSFEVDPDSGIIHTNLPHYMNYRDGYFNITAEVKDSAGRAATGDVIIYVLVENRRLKYVFGVDPTEVYSWRDNFLSEVTNNLEGAAINVDDVQYHITSAGDRSRDATDMCFHVVKDNKIMPADEALKLMDSKENVLESTYNRYQVDSVGLCEIKVTTRWWDGWWWLWWLLIALAILIFILALILIIALCCCWYRFRDYEKTAKPYVVLDPMDIPINKEYEWQETTVKMD